jgi:hypothetical protein
MGRPPIAKVAMTPAERQQKRRQKLDMQVLEKWKPKRRGSSVRRPEKDFLILLSHWLRTANEEEVARFLGNNCNDSSRWERIAEHVKTLIS